MPPLPLFREQSVDSVRNRLEGNIILQDRPALQVAAYSLPLLLVPFLVSTLFWPYARVEQVPGWLTTTEGLVLLRAERAGLLEELLFKEGDYVKAGTVVANVRNELAQPALGETPEAALLSFLKIQRQRLDSQIVLARARGRTELERVTGLLEGLQQELHELDQQIEHQESIVAASWRDVVVAEKLVRQGFATGREARARRNSWSEQTRDQANLRQQRAALQVRISSARADLERLPVDLDSELARFESDRAELAQRQAEIEGRRRYSVIAPISGRITSVNARRGYAVDARKPLMTMVPSGGVLEAELFVPTSASAFVKNGQRVRLLYDAFPYQRFGSDAGTVTQVSQSSLAPGDVFTPVNLPEPVYIVRVKLAHASVAAFGEQVSLKPGMTLKANIVLEERSVFAWIFEPLYAVRRRT